jgi:hypothetical protein
MRFFNKGKGKKSDDGSSDHMPGPPSFDIPGFIVAMEAGGRATFFDYLTPPEPEDEFPHEEPELQ